MSKSTKQVADRALAHPRNTIEDVLASGCCKRSGKKSDGCSAVRYEQIPLIDRWLPATPLDNRFASITIPIDSKPKLPPSIDHDNRVFALEYTRQD
jgi:hypothetical protein